MNLILLSIFALFATPLMAQDLGESMNIVVMIQTYAEILAQFLLAAMLVATVAVRIIPGKSDDEAVAAIWIKIQKFLGYLPTFGINPRTAKLEAALEELRAQNAARDANKEVQS